VIAGAAESTGSDGGIVQEPWAQAGANRGLWLAAHDLLCADGAGREARRGGMTVKLRSLPSEPSDSSYQSTAKSGRRCGDTGGLSAQLQHGRETVTNSAKLAHTLVAFRERGKPVSLPIAGVSTASAWGVSRCVGCVNAGSRSAFGCSRCLPNRRTVCDDSAEFVAYG